MSTARARRAVAIAIATFIIAADPVGTVSGLPCWQPPVRAPVTDPHREPACRWCPGNRGIEYGTRKGATVRSVATGRVTFSGTIAGTGYVVVRLGSGLRVTYGNLAERRFGRGEVVARGAVVGVAAGRVHLGLRDGERYLDPAPYLGRWVHRPRLVPTDGSPGSPAPRPTLRCGR